VSGADLPEHGAGERRVAARGVAWGGIESGAAALVGLLLTPLVLRVAGLEGLGLWGAAWSLAHTAGLLDLGVGASYGRFAARALARGDVAELNDTLAVGVGFHMALAGIIGLPAILMAPKLIGWFAPQSPHLPEARVVVTCTLLTVMVRSTLSAYRGVITGAQRLDRLGRLGAIMAVCEGAGGALALLAGAGLRGMAINSLLMAGVSSGAEAALAHRLCPGLRLRPFRAGADSYRRVLNFGSRLQVTRGCEILAAHLPRLTLAAGPGLTAAGLYDLGARVAGLVALPASLPLRVILPLAGHLDARGDAGRLAALLSRATRYVALLALPCAGLVLLDARSLLLAWTGQPAPAESVAVARWLAAGVSLTLLASPLRLVLRGTGHPGLEAAATAAAAVTQAALALILAGRWGAPGVGLATFAGAAMLIATLLAGLWRLGRQAGALQAAHGLVAPFLALTAALAGGWLVGVVASLPGLPENATRLEALAALAYRGPVMASLFLLTSWRCGALLPADLELLRDAILPRRTAGRRAA
jgi:O-antigen/teichoic acid export membrane protein